MHQEKQCFKCQTTKPLSDFYKHPKMADGHVNKCKECNKRDVRENRAGKIAKYISYEKSRAMRPHRVGARKEYAATERGRQSAKVAKLAWKRNNTEKSRAHVVLRNAVRSGAVSKPTHCEGCGGSGRIHGHHDDYAAPLAVRWLCPACHRAWHREHGSGSGR